MSHSVEPRPIGKKPRKRGLNSSSQLYVTGLASEEVS